ncbi:ribosomal protein LP1 [Acrasis kona]|uniref:Ribosomal protein LP1 n=1 Tax=Acrasis kona TaxID=1008807 RepID=A0AAW2ZRA4_9EUKA
MTLPAEYTQEKVESLACVYAALILHDEKIAITGDAIKSLVAAANVKVAPYWPGLFAKALAGKDVSALLANVGGGSSGAPAAGSSGSAPAAAAEEKKEEKKKVESESESEEEMGFGGLF